MQQQVQGSWSDLQPQQAEQGSWDDLIKASKASAPEQGSWDDLAKASAPAAPAQAPDSRTAWQVLKDQVGAVKNAAIGSGSIPERFRAGMAAGQHPWDDIIKPALSLVAELPSNVGKSASNILSNLQALREAVGPEFNEKTGQYGPAPPTAAPAPSPQENREAAGAATKSLQAALLAKGATSAGGKLANELLPNTERAGSNFQTVMGQARNVPVDTTAADTVAARAQELSNRGTTLPKVFSDYIKNPPATYEAGRDFASNAGRLSVEQAASLNPTMGRQVALFADALKTANREAAAKGGMGDLYDSAMKEYHQASTLSEAGDVLKKYGTKAALTAALGGASYGVYRELTKP